MARKQHRIKHYHQKTTTYKARPHPVSVIVSVLGLALLVFLGVSIYQPVYDFIMGNRDPKPPAPPVAEQSQEDEAPGAAAGETNEGDSPADVRRDALRMVYLPLETARDTQALDRFIAGLPQGYGNTVLVDIKDVQGTVLFNTQNSQALEWGAVSPNPIDLAALSASLEQSGYGLAVRMPAFRDPLAAVSDRSITITYQNTEYRWLDAAADAGGKAWLNPYAEGARKYLADLGAEAVRMGAKLVILQDVQFPRGSDSPNANFGAGAGSMTRSAALGKFVEEITDAVEKEGGRLGVYLSALTLTQASANEVLYGGSPLEMLGNNLVLGVLPWEFGSGFEAEGLKLEAPAENPAATVSTLLAYAKGVLSPLNREDIQIIPLLQGGSESAGPVDGAAVKAMLEAVSGAGCGEYVLFQTAGNYPAAA